MKKRHVMAFLRALFVLLTAARLSGAGDLRVFRADAAVGDITPELGAIIIGGTPARHVHDPLQVRVLVLDDGASGWPANAPGWRKCVS